MKILVFFMAVLLISTSSVFAHPPREIKVELKEGQVKVVVIHPAPNPKRHYIKRIEIEITDQEKLEKTFIKQNGNVQKAVFQIPPLKAGDRLQIVGYCSRFGELKKEIEIE